MLALVALGCGPFPDDPDTPGPIVAPLTASSASPSTGPAEAARPSGPPAEALVGVKQR